jgi:hypothetical protein
MHVEGLINILVAHKPSQSLKYLVAEMFATNDVRFVAAGCARKEKSDYWVKA